MRLYLLVPVLTLLTLDLSSAPASASSIACDDIDSYQKFYARLSQNTQGPTKLISSRLAGNSESKCAFISKLDGVREIARAAGTVCIKAKHWDSCKYMPWSHFRAGYYAPVKSKDIFYRITDK
ncbi:MAG: hypothetical protein JKY49_00730 [Cohaesibacteraceae bacterium]|nr:hypothetical protein [Cohaesibacteraceae bacterium]